MDLRRTSPYSLLVIVILVLTLIALLGLLSLGIVRAVTPDAPAVDTEQDETTTSPTDTSSTSATAEPVAEDVTLPQTADRGQAYQDSIIFVGDSTTAHLRSRGVLTGGKETTQVWVPADNTLLLDLNITKKKIVYPATGIEMTIADAAAKEKPAYMVLTVGINGITSFVKNENLFKNCYGNLIKAIKEASPDTKIMLQSIFPVADNQKVFSVDAATVNDYIDTVNGFVRELAAEQGVRYLDTASALKGADGKLPMEYQNGDGLHLTAEGYGIILTYIRTHAYQS